MRGALQQREQMHGPAAHVLEVRGLSTRFRTPAGEVAAIEDVDLDVDQGQTLALVGESGSGKSVTSLSIMRLLPERSGRIASGSIGLSGKDGVVRDLAALEGEALRRVRGNDIGMIFQEPMTSLNPVYTVGDQIAEPIRIHERAGRSQAMQRAVELLAHVGIPDPERRVRLYPHELSGGMRQRVTIAMALACRPTVLIADEPTTALDVTIQAQILDLLRRLQREEGMGVLFVTHNLGVVAEIAGRVAVMYAGRIVEIGPVKEIFRHPRHPYTIGLLASVPKLGQASALKRAGGRLPSIPGTVPSIAARPPGCAFANRCRMVQDACRARVPPLALVGEGHLSRCLRWPEL